MKRLLWLFTIICVRLGDTKNLRDKDLISALLILNTTADVIHDTDRKISKLQYIRQDHFKTAAFEIGYLSYTLQEKYRKMVDKYNTSVHMKTRLYLMELVIYLEEIERHYWQIEHISNMIHEVERKYRITTDLHTQFDDRKTTRLNADPIIPNPVRRKTKKMRKFRMNKFWKTSTPSITKTSTKWWDLEYGMFVGGLFIPPLHEKILEEASWSLKLKLLKDYVQSKTSETPRQVGLHALVIGSRNNGLRRREEKSKHGKSRDRKSYLDKSEDYWEKKHITINGRRQENQSSGTTPYLRDDEENNMRMKLFRLMYETVRDSDLKVKRAELIKSHYQNSTVFDIGFIMGDVIDKFNIMNDVSTTLTRLRQEWKPLEHINAYEQIANQAIEISHLIELMRHIGKRSNLTIL